MSSLVNGVEFKKNEVLGGWKECTLRIIVYNDINILLACEGVCFGAN